MAAQESVLRKAAWRVLLRVGAIQPKPTLHDIHTSERIVEYGWVLRNLDLEPGAGTVLDVGCNQTYFPKILASLGYRVTGADYGPPTVAHPNFRYMEGDVAAADSPLGDEQFDRVLAISVIEHVGINTAYQEYDENADLAVFESMKARVKPGGRLLVTVPMGQGIGPQWRAYTPERIAALGKDLHLERADYFLEREPRVWAPVPEAEAAAVKYGGANGFHTRACAGLVWRRP